VARVRSEDEWLFRQREKFQKKFAARELNQERIAPFGGSVSVHAGGAMMMRPENRKRRHASWSAVIF
jgi:hypothetical protein